jgi:outer membrane protein assembly factor BamB
MKKWLKRLAIGVGVLIAVVAVLRVGFGLHVYMDGDFGLHLGWGRTSAHYDALEAQRAAQREASPKAPQPPPSAAPPAPAAPAPATAATTTSPPPAAGTAAAAATLPAPASAPPAPAVSASWTDFRGPARDGVYRQRPVAATWPAGGPRMLWKQPVGEGHASFVIARGVAYTIEQRRGREVVAAYDVKTGREIWTTGWDTHFSERMGGDGPRATPTYHDGVVYALGAAGELCALRAASGETIWRTNILEDTGATNLQWAMAASPLVFSGKVIVEPGGPGASVVAYDAATGKPVWKSQDDQPAYTSPMLVTLAGRPQIVTVLGRRAIGLAVDDGTLLWAYPWETDNQINVAQPIVIGPSQLFLSSGYGKGAALVDIVAADGRFEARTVWSNNRMKNKLSSSVLRDGFVYGLDEGILACVEAATGRLAWKGGRYGHGQLILAGDRLLITTETGELALVHATPAAFEEIARVPGIEGRTWNVPAIDDGILLVRNANEMAAFDVASSDAR